MEGLGLGADLREDVRPGSVDVNIDAYGGWGPWVTRRGFDSLVQMSTGIAEAGMDAAGAGHPVPLPVQTLDQATGYLLAAGTLTGLALHQADGAGSRWLTSLARIARLLMDAGTVEPPDGPGIDPRPREPMNWSSGHRGATPADCRPPWWSTARRCVGRSRRGTSARRSRPGCLAEPSGRRRFLQRTGRTCRMPGRVDQG
jgi:crotonobetainyl-CoA:carnitine CoA-transferase CaiB-like acyl-CoA transferase